MPWFTVVTSTLNSLESLKLTADSIFLQSYQNWQWIIVDGASTDGTKDWLAQTIKSRQQVVFISEPDTGIYDAWNKAIPLIQGDWVIFLGAGDKLKNSKILETCVGYLEEIPPQINLAYGYIEYIDDIDSNSGELVKKRWEGIDGKWGWCRPVVPNHQGVFHRKDFLTCSGGFDTNLKIVGDMAMLIPELIHNGAVELPFCVSLRVRIGLSLDPKNRMKVLREIIKSNRKIGLGRKRVIYQYAAFLYHMVKTWSARKEARKK